jgi:hypothetical protein
MASVSSIIAAAVALYFTIMLFAAATLIFVVFDVIFSRVI